MKISSLLLLTAAAYGGTLARASGQLVTFNNASDVTNSFREIRASANDMTHVATAGSDGVTNGFVRFTTSADNGAVRYAFDANGATAGTSTFSTGFVAMDINYSIDSKNFGIFAGVSNTNAIGWQLRTNNAGTFENASARFGINNTDNFTLGTTMTTTSATSFSSPTGSPAFPGGTSSDTFANVGTFAPGNWFSVRLDYGLNGSNERTMQLRFWTGILDTNTGLGTGTLAWDQSLVVNGTDYIGPLEVGVFTANNTAGAVSIDNFQVSVIPEPQAAGLLAFGVLGVAMIRRRK